jgi:hypothetical protein
MTMSDMSPDDCKRQAEAAMSKALAATGDDRQEWMRLAIAWLQLARNATDHGQSAGHQDPPRAEGAAD